MPRNPVYTEDEYYMTFEEIAQAMGITEKAVRAILSRALNKIRNHPRFEEFVQELTPPPPAPTNAELDRILNDIEKRSGIDQHFMSDEEFEEEIENFTRTKEAI